MSIGYNYGTESGVNTSSGNTELIMPGGLIYDTTIESGGTEIVMAGGTTGFGGGGVGEESSSETVINGGTLALQNGANVDANIVFGTAYYEYGNSSGGLLVIDNLSNVSGVQIQGFTLGNKIDLAGVPYSSAATASFSTSTYVLQISENSINYDVQLDAYATPPAGVTFALVPDGTGGTDVVLAVSVSYFNSNETTLNNLTGFAVSDTAANVYSNLSGLESDYSHITSITATGGQVVVGNGLFVADEAALNLIVGGFAISGQASVLSGNLSGLEADISHINSITGLNGTITASVAQFSSDEAALNEVVGGFAISDLASNVYSNLPALDADASHIASITATGGTVTVGNGLFVADQAALNEIVGGFAISGQASVLSGNLNNLEADISHINSINGLNGTITATAAEFLPDLTALNKVNGGYDVDLPNGYEVDVTINGATNISNADLILSGTVGLIFDGTTTQNITMTTQEYNDFTTITDGSGRTAANSTVIFTDSGTVTTNSAVGNYDLAATGGDAITIGTAGTVGLGSHTSGDTITFGTATSSAEVTGWNYTSDILMVSTIGTDIVAATPADLTFNAAATDVLSMGHVNFVTDGTNAGNEVAFYTNLSNYAGGNGHLDTGGTAANAILIVNDGTHSLDDVFYVVGNGTHGATSVTLIGTYDLATAHFTATLLA